MQVAADPEHPNKHHGTPPPLALRMHLLSFQETAGKKKWKSCSLSEPNSFDMKNTFIYI